VFSLLGVLTGYPLYLPIKLGGCRFYP